MDALLSGSECSTSSNPLSQLLKQQQTDHSLHQSQFATPSSAAPSTSIRQPLQQARHNAEAQKFFQGPAQPQHAFNLEALHRELPGAQQQQQQPHNWSSQFSQMPGKMNGASNGDLSHFEHRFAPSPQPAGADLAGEFMRTRHTPSPAGAGAPAAAGASMQAYSSQYRPQMMFGGSTYMNQSMPSQHMHANSQQSADLKGKSRFVELNDEDWEAQFAKVAKEHEPEQQAAQSKDKGKQKVDDTINLLEGEPPIDADESDAELMKNLEQTWKNLQDTLHNQSASDAEMAAWEAQYGAQIDGDSGLGDDLTAYQQWNKDNVDSFLQDPQPFAFAEENKFVDHPDPFAEGQRLLAEGAPLSEAALAFEAACRLDPTRGEAWRAAGETWAADEREARGIRALEKAVACGGKDAIAAWLSLAVAYVNEGQELRALATLEKWMTLAYPSIQVRPLEKIEGPWDASHRVIDMFLAAARAGPQARAPGQQDDAALSANPAVDADVQVGLGVLFYSNSDYDRARDCFEAALSIRPNDFLLWNRLGATLANGGLPEEAISAYRRALDLRPTFTRATYNLGVSCLNIGCYHEAAEHLLAAIEGQRRQQRTGPGNNGSGNGNDGEADDESANIFHTLRRAFLCEERHDLADKASPSTPLSFFREAGYEF